MEHQDYIYHEIEMAWLPKPQVGLVMNNQRIVLRALMVPPPVTVVRRVASLGFECHGKGVSKFEIVLSWYIFPLMFFSKNPNKILETYV